jgi:wyosine [tRNA(Phe)-imidazoG37] synthetase (radical SAM superfamily)
MGSKYLQEVKISPKYGKLLPINFNPYNLKSVSVYPAEEIFYDIKSHILNCGSPDYIWLKAPNDLSIYPGLRRLIKLIKLEFPVQKIGLYTNSMLFQSREAREDFQECDLIATNLNSIDSHSFKSVCGCKEPVSLEDVKEGIKEFSKQFEGEIFIYTMFFKGTNDTVSCVKELKDFLLEILPDSLSIGEYAEGSFEPLSKEFKKYLRESFNDAPFNIYYNLVESI